MKVTISSTYSSASIWVSIYLLILMKIEVIPKD